MAQVRIQISAHIRSSGGIKRMSVFCGKKKKKKKRMKKKGTWIAGALLLAVCVLAACLAVMYKPKTTVGEKEVTIVVVHGDETKKEFVCRTDAEYLREVLEEQELIEGEDGPYGIFIKAVDKETADDSRQQWWCITKGGEQVNTSADQTPVQNGEQYELTLKEGW